MCSSSYLGVVKKFNADIHNRASCSIHSDLITISDEKRRAEFRQPIFPDGLSNLLHEIEKEMEVVPGCQPQSQQFSRFDQMPDISAGIVFACVAGAFPIHGGIV